MEQSQAAPLRPIPLPDEFTREFWAATREHKLSIQRCRTCRHWNHVPNLSCRACGGEDLAFEQVSGRGKLYSWCVLNEPPGPGFRDMMPVIIAVVELEEQPRLYIAANLLNTSAEKLSLGLPVRVTFEALGDECVLPQFELAA